MICKGNVKDSKGQPSNFFPVYFPPLHLLGRRGRPENTWRRNLEAETRRMGYTKGQLETLAQNRVSGTDLLRQLYVLPHTETEVADQTISPSH